MKSHRNYFTGALTLPKNYAGLQLSNEQVGLTDAEIKGVQGTPTLPAKGFFLVRLEDTLDYKLYSYDTSNSTYLFTISFYSNT